MLRRGAHARPGQCQWARIMDGLAVSTLAALSLLWHGAHLLPLGSRLQVPALPQPCLLNRLIPFLGSTTAIQNLSASDLLALDASSSNLAVQGEQKGIQNVWGK